MGMRWHNTAQFLAVFTTCSCVWCIKSSYLIWQSPGAHQSRHGTAGTAVHRHLLIDSYQFNAQHLAARLNLACQQPRPKITHCSHTSVNKTVNVYIHVYHEYFTHYYISIQSKSESEINSLIPQNNSNMLN